jgi:hypothetical protein
MVRSKELAKLAMTDAALGPVPHIVPHPRSPPEGILLAEGGPAVGMATLTAGLLGAGIMAGAIA